MLTVHKEDREDAAAVVRQRTREIVLDDELTPPLLLSDRDEQILRHVEEAERATAPHEAAVALRRAAHLLETEKADPGRAFLTLQEAFRRDPGALEVVDDLERLANRLNRWEELLNLADAAMLQVDEPARLAELWCRVARWSRLLGRREQALEAAQSALGLAPGSSAALMELEEGYRGFGYFGPLVRVLTLRVRTLESAPGPASPHEPPDSEAARGPRSELLDLHLELASLYEDKLQDDDSAIASCQEALRLDDRNSTALARLERLATKPGRSALLVETIERRLAASGDPKERIALSLRLAGAWESQGHDDRAIRALGGVLNDPGDDPELLRAMARLLRRTGDGSSLAGVLGRLYQLALRVDERVTLARELGALHAEMLNNPDEAERYLVAALAQDASDAGTVRLLGELWRKRGEWARLGDLMARAGHAARAAGDRVAFLLEAAEIFRGHLNDRRTAHDLLLAVSAIEPTNEQAVERLLDDALASNDWARVRAVLSPLLEHAESLSLERRTAGHAWVARAAEACGDRKEALRHWRQAAHLCPANRAHQKALAAALVAEGHLGEAGPVLELLWRQEIPDESDEERAEHAYQLGRARMARQDRPGARTAFEAATALQPSHLEALAAMAELRSQEGDVAGAVLAKTELLRRLGDPARKRALAMELARLYSEEMLDPGRALRVLNEALSQSPGSHQLLHAMLDLHVAARNWRRAIDVLLSLADGVRGLSQAKYLAAAAAIAERELRAWDEAAALYDRALDAAPTALEIFERLDRLLTANRAFAAQAKAYRAMLTRLEAQATPNLPAARIALLRGLGEIYRTRLKDYRAAATAFEAAAALQPHDRQCRVILTELYELTGPDTWHRALADRQRLLTEAPSLADMVPHLRAVLHLSLRMDDAARAFRAAEGLVALGAATAEERGLCERQVPPTQVPSVPLPEAGWERIVHPDEDPRFSMVFAALGRALLLARSQVGRAWGLAEPDSQERYALEHSGLVRLTAQLADLLRVPRPAFRFRPELPGLVDLAPVRLRNGVMSTLVAGAEMLQPRPTKEMMALVAKKLALLRSEHLLLWPTIAPTLLELQVAVAAAGRLHGPGRENGWSRYLTRPKDRVLNRYARFLRSALAPQELERIGAVASDLHPEAVSPWARGAFLTAGRAGLLVSGDLAACVRLTRPEALGALTVRSSEQIRDLVTWNVSDAAALLRLELGLPAPSGTVRGSSLVGHVRAG